MKRVFTVQVANTRVIKYYTISAYSEDHAHNRAATLFEKETNKEVTGTWITFAQDMNILEDEETILDSNNC